MYLNDCCAPGGSCPVCNYVEPPEMEHTFTVWEEPQKKYPEEAYGLVRVIVQDDPDDLPDLVDLIADYDPDEVPHMPGFENPTLTLDQIRELAELGHLDGELLKSEEL